jgi:hypothetical protein
MKERSVLKHFNKVSKAGLGIAKNGKYQLPYKFLTMDIQTATDNLNAYGQNRPKVGDYCAAALPSGVLSAGTVGKIIAEDPDGRGHDGTYTIQFLNGKIGKEWRYGVAFLTEEQAKEVRDYYTVQEKRPGRIKHDFWARP